MSMGVPTQFSAAQYIHFLADLAKASRRSPLAPTELTQAVGVVQVCPPAVKGKHTLQPLGGVE